MAEQIQIPGASHEFGGQEPVNFGRMAIGGIARVVENTPADNHTPIIPAAEVASESAEPSINQSNNPWQTQTADGHVHMIPEIRRRGGSGRSRRLWGMASGLGRFGVSTGFGRGAIERKEDDDEEGDKTD